MSQLQKRILSAAIAAALCLLTYIYFSKAGLHLLIMAVSWLCFNEYVNLQKEKIKINLLSVILSHLFFLSTLYFLYSLSSFINLILSFTIYCSLILWSTRHKDDSTHHMKAYNTITAMAFAVFYCALLPFTVALTLNVNHGEIYFLLFLVIIIATDTFAYFTGKSIGSRKLFPSISPNKTVEGLIGGVLAAVFFSQLALKAFTLNVSSTGFILVAICTSLMGINGDLLASLIKRVHKVKDTGSIMPGHGGLIDRLDGVLLAAPVYYWFVTQIIP